MFRPLLVAHALGAGYFLVWLLLAHTQGLPISTIALDPLSAVELALREIQQHPEEGIHALARLELPPYTGILHLSAALLWASALTMALRAGAIHALFPLLMLQDTLFLSAERLPMEKPVEFIYAAACVLSIAAARARLDAPRAAALVCAMLWLTLRVFADQLPVGAGWAGGLEAFAALHLPVAWCVYLLSPGASASTGVRA